MGLEFFIIMLLLTDNTNEVLEVGVCSKVYREQCKNLDLAGRYWQDPLDFAFCHGKAK